MNIYLIIILISYLAVTGFGYWLEYLNMAYLKRYGSVVPSEFQGQIDNELLIKTQNYTIENTKYGIVLSVFNSIIALIFIFGGLLNIYNTWIESLNLPFMAEGIIFFITLYYVESIITMPFNLYQVFIIERKYGFNNTNPKLWLTDFIKSIILSTIIMGIVIAIGLFIVTESPDFWWLWVWGFFLIFSIFIMYVSPYIIEPLFNKFTPIDDESLVQGINSLMKKVGIMVSRVFKIDASKRTSHTNAYFTGIGKVKRIVLYDTLLKKMNIQEILSVLAHEAGHWKKKHLLKSMIVIEGIGLIAFYVSFRLLKFDLLTELFHIEKSTFFAKLVVLAFLGEIVMFPFTPFLNFLSRMHEKEADRFACEITDDPESMISTLVKLSKDNLSNLHPHPVYAAFHYSHPPIIQRIKFIRDVLTKK
ncbi:MAG: M48 family metallopeptidase [Deltaproteobacteria bacterium]|nr:M48 family metallopeptidase [Deltaproteobacteria bacterium]MCL5792449.1 M48 family metallopeptidase [Deltaproteobacteria bacterium]